MKFSPCLFALVLLCACPTRADDATRPAAHIDHKGLVKLGWQLACQGSTFSDRSFMEMVDLMHSLGFHHIELAPGQPLAPDAVDVRIGSDLPGDNLAQLLAKLKSVHMDIVSFGPVNFTNDQKEARQIFQFAKSLKAKDIVGSASLESLPMLDDLAGEFGVRVAITKSVNPDMLLQALSGRSDRIGACADISDWRASGSDPMQCLSKLSGHIVECHLSDVNADDPDLNKALQWFKQQNFKGIFAIQCDRGSGDQRVNNFIAQVNAFSDQVTELAAGNSSQ